MRSLRIGPEKSKHDATLRVLKPVVNLGTCVNLSIRFQSIFVVLQALGIVFPKINEMVCNQPTKVASRFAGL